MLAGLKNTLDGDATSNQDLSVNWSKVKDWKEDTRYRRMDETDARELYNAIADQVSGVMKWIKARW